MDDAKGLSEYPYYRCEINECARFLDEKDRADALAERVKACEIEYDIVVKERDIARGERDFFLKMMNRAVVQRGGFAASEQD